MQIALQLALECRLMITSFTAVRGSIINHGKYQKRMHLCEALRIQRIPIFYGIICSPASSCGPS